MAARAANFLPPGVLQPRETVLRIPGAPNTPTGRLGKLRLDANENTVGASPRVIEAMIQYLSEERASVYPEYAAAKGELAAYFDVDPNDFILTNGTEEAIQVLANTYIDASDEVITLSPSYGAYARHATMAGSKVREIPYRKEKLAFPLEELLEAITPTTRAVMLANPNNPTGTATTRANLRKILDRAANAAVLVDEAYYEFCGVTLLGMINDFANLFVTRTFSTAHGMAGMRVGCLFSQSENVEFLHKAQAPYSVNAIATVAVRAAIRDKAYIEKYVTEVLAARELLYVGLEELGIPYYESKANFVLVEMADRAAGVRDELRARGILVHTSSRHLRGCVRVTVGTREQVRRFLKELTEIW